MDICEIVDDTVATWEQVQPATSFAAMGTMLKINALAQRVLAQIETMAQAYGVTTGEFDVLATLRRHGDQAHLTPSFIAGVALVSPSGLTHRLTQLEKAGHIIRTPDPNDRRSFLISITDTGCAIADEIVQFIAQISDAIVQHVPATQQSDFVSDLEQCIETVTEMNHPAQPSKVLISAVSKS